MPKKIISILLVWALTLSPVYASTILMVDRATETGYSHQHMHLADTAMSVSTQKHLDIDASVSSHDSACDFVCMDIYQPSFYFPAISGFMMQKPVPYSARYLSVTSITRDRPPKYTL